MDRDLLYKKISEQGLSIGEMGQQLGISRSSFYRKTRGISEFTQGEIERICVILHLESPVDIFFSQKVS